MKGLTEMRRRTGPGVVLVEPREEGNIGAAARAMSNMGLRRLLLVRPANHLSSEAMKMSPGGRDILLKAEVFETLPDALSEFDFVVGTTRRQGSVREGRVSPRAAAAEVAERGSEGTAMVFGRERSGLTNSEIDLCHRLVTIPTSEDQGSLNLAQAVLILSYEILMALSATESKEASRDVASHGELEGMYGHMERVLLEIGYLHENNPGRMMRSFRRIFSRAGLNGREVRALRGIFHQMEWFSGRRRGRSHGVASVDRAKRQPLKCSAGSVLRREDAE